METWLLSTASRKSLAPYLMVPTLTPYDLPFSHNTSVMTDKQTDRRTDDNRANSSTVT